MKECEIKGLSFEETESITNYIIFDKVYKNSACKLILATYDNQELLNIPVSISLVEQNGKDGISKIELKESKPLKNDKYIEIW